MAIKQGKNTEETQGNAQNTAGNAQGAAQGAPAPAKRRGGPRGPRLNPPFVWTRERQVKLVEVLKQDLPPGAVRTARSVANALNADPLFREQNVSPQKIVNFLEVARTSLEESQKPVPAYLTLDKARLNKVDVGLFS